MLVLPSAGNGSAVLRYILDYPGLCAHLAHLPATWSLPSAHSTDTPIHSVCDIFGMVCSLLLASLHTLVTPTSASMTISLSVEVQEVLLTLLSSASAVVKTKLQYCLTTATTTQSSTTTESSKTTEECSEDTMEPIMSTEHSMEPSAEPSAMPNPDTKEKKLKKLQKQQQASQLQFLRSLEYTLNILVGEGGYAVTFRAVCSTTTSATMQSNRSSVYTLCIILQAMFLQFADDSLAIINEMLIIMTHTEEIDENNSSNSSSSVLKTQIEIVKKKLKTLQGLLREGSTSKSD